MTSIFNKIAEISIPWLFDHGIKIVLILVLAYLAHTFLSYTLDRIVRKVISKRDNESLAEETRREDTLIRIFSTSGDILIFIVTLMMGLQELGFQIAPLLATAGVAGLAFGFGGQYLIRDIITGLFIILENQYRIGDVVSICGVKGTIEDISMRMTTLRDMDGVVHHVPHGEVKVVSNLSKQFARINMEIGIAYNSDIDHVIAVINQVGLEFAADPLWADAILTPPAFLRIQDFSDSAIIVKILGETKPLSQWELAGELRKRLKIAFDREKIEIPFPQRVLHMAQKDQS